MEFVDQVANHDKQRFRLPGDRSTNRDDLKLNAANDVRATP